MRERPVDAYLPRTIADRPRPAGLPAPARPLVDDANVDALAHRAVAGDLAALGKLYDELVGPVYRYVALRVRRREDAEDLTQLVFVKVLEALPRYQARGVPFGGWLFRLARNVVIDHIRTRREHVTLDLAAERPATEGGPDELAALRQELDSVATALRRLTPEQREAIELRFFAGLSAKEAAMAMDRQEGTVRGLQFRGIAALRRELGIEPGADEQSARVSGDDR